ncbi:hypothetical protein [Corynebacterium lubricantis]|uniref:hypothetical protein n=1 Tax=Corynebacterium lubricantis TaxID=541095 RepID=UPI00038234D7|nr:hypothetical protein [Corynebacterium lubricantis]
MVALTLGVDLSISTSEVRSHAASTGLLIDELAALRSRTIAAGLGENFTPIAGLRQLGHYHGQCLKGAEGSSVAAIDFLTRIVGFAAESFEADAHAIDRVDDAHALALRGLAHEPVQFSFPLRPTTGSEAVGTLPTGATALQSAGVPAPDTMASLRSGLEATSLAEVEEGAVLWAELARVSSSVADHFLTTSSALESGSSGTLVEASTQTLREFAGLAEAIASSAQVMEFLVRIVTGIVNALRGALGLLDTGLAGLPEEVRRLVERSFLDAVPDNLVALVSRALAPFASLLNAVGSRWDVAGLPELVWPENVAARMCCCEPTVQDVDGTGAEPEAIALDTASTDTASVGGAGAASLTGVGGAAGLTGGIVAPSSALGHVPGIVGALGAGVAMAPQFAGHVPAGISVGSSGQRNGALGGVHTGMGPMMAPLGAGRSTAVPNNKRSPAVGAGLR